MHPYTYITQTRLYTNSRKRIGTHWLYWEHNTRVYILTCIHTYNGAAKDTRLLVRDTDRECTRERTTHRGGYRGAYSAAYANGCHKYTDHTPVHKHRRIIDTRMQLTGSNFATRCGENRWEPVERSTLLEQCQ